MRLLLSEDIMLSCNIFDVNMLF
uniref:Uncharacterized protein n=1 Tax=Rhizophora mucronata TaxID=61149 RepID=A0A2P2N6D7_RHIMU